MFVVVHKAPHVKSSMRCRSIKQRAYLGYHVPDVASYRERFCQEKAMDGPSFKQDH